MTAAGFGERFDKTWTARKSFAAQHVRSKFEKDLGSVAEDAMVAPGKIWQRHSV